jgi:hypothetical protein
MYSTKLKEAAKARKQYIPILGSISRLIESTSHLRLTFLLLDVILMDIDRKWTSVANASDCITWAMCEQLYRDVSTQLSSLQSISYAKLASQLELRSYIERAMDDSWKSRATFADDSKVIRARDKMDLQIMNASMTSRGFDQVLNYRSV